MKLIGDQVIECTSFSSYFHKMAAGGHFGFSDRVLPLQVINGCVNYEFDTCIGVAVT